MSFGDTGDAVAAVQREVGVDDDGIFGPITRGAVSRFQQRMGLPVTGSVDAKTWAALFKSNISFVGGGGKTVTTVSHGGGTAAETPGTPDDSGRPRRSARRRRRRRRGRKTKRPTTNAPNYDVDRRGHEPRGDHEAGRAPRRSPTRRPPRRRASAAAAARASWPRPSRARRPASTARIAARHAHAGKDIAAPTGTTVRAAQCGTVTKAGADSGGYGNLVCIQHEGGVSTCYAHLSSIGTKVGSYVHVGDVIGKVGCTG